MARKTIEWGAAALLVGGLLFVMFMSWQAAQERTRVAAEKAAADQRAAEAAKAAEKARHRPTFALSPAELVDRYNAAMKDLDRSMLLPPVSAMQDNGTNGVFRSIKHQVASNVFMLMEIDIKSGQPFSLGLMAAGDGKVTGSAHILMALTGLGLTFFERGDPAGLLVRTCGKAMNASPPSITDTSTNLEVYCGTAAGLWIAGIAAPSKP